MTEQTNKVHHLVSYNPMVFTVHVAGFAFGVHRAPFLPPQKQSTSIFSDEKRVSQDMIYCPVLFILLKGSGTSCLGGGIFVPCPVILYISKTFNIPLNHSRSCLIVEVPYFVCKTNNLDRP